LLQNNPVALSPLFVDAGDDRQDVLGFSKPALSKKELKLPALNNQVNGSAIVSEQLSEAPPFSSILLGVNLRPFGRKEGVQGHKFFRDIRRDAIATLFSRSFLFRPFHCARCCDFLARASAQGEEDVTSLPNVGMQVKAG
jgi:hypothetical protein